MLVLLAGIAILLTAIYWRVRPGWRQSGPFLPDALLIGLGLYAGGSTWLLVFAPAPNQLPVAAMAWTALASAAAGSALYCLATSRLYRGRFVESLAGVRAGMLERAGIVAGLALSASACLLFLYLLVRTDAIAVLLGIGMFAADLDLMQARVLIASGTEAWLAPGYFKQLTDILLPVLLAAAILLDRRCLKSVWFWVTVSVALLAIVVAGQRLVLVLFLLTLALAAHYARAAEQQADGRKPGWRVPLIPAILLVAGYGLVTILLGRVGGDAGAGAVIIDVVANFLDRAFLAAPRENAITYPVWSELGPTAGLSWLQDLARVMPGTRESLSNVLHMAAGGSQFGDSPLGMPPDIWLAWGWPGLVLVPAVFGVLIGCLDLVCHARRSPALVGLQFYLFLVLPVCYSPYIFLLYGGGVALILVALVAFVRPSDTPESRRVPGIEHA